MSNHLAYTWLVACFALATHGCGGCDDAASNSGPVATATATASATVTPIAAPRRSDILDAHVRLAAGMIPMMLQAMADNGLERVINLAGGNRADHSLDLWMAMQGEVKGRIVQCWNPPWSLLKKSKGDPTPLVHDLMDSVGMKYACASVGAPDAARPPGLRIDDPRFDPIWAKAAELRLPVYLHVQTDLPRRHPATRFILTRLPTGDIEAVLGDRRNVFMSLSAFGGSAPLSLIRRFPDRFVFGSGLAVTKEIRLAGSSAPLPYGELRPRFDAMRQALLPLGQDLRDRVYRTNLLAIF